MFSTRIRALVRQQWVGLIALFFALTGGAAWATHPGGANTINSADIIDDQVRTADIGNGEVREADVGQAAVTSDEVKNDTIAAGDVAPNSLTSAKIADGSLTGTDVANNSLKGDDVDESTLNVGDAARAYGRVAADGALTRSTNVSSVTHTPGTGVYCIDPASGIDSNSAVLVVGPDVTGSGTDDSVGVEDVSVAQWRSEGSGCLPGTLEVDTFVYEGDSLDDNTGGGSTFGDDLVAEEESFSFVVP
jgi:hypothetical protein